MSKEFEYGREEDYGNEGIDDMKYEFSGGDGSLYESRIDHIDELKTLRDTL